MYQYIWLYIFKNNNTNKDKLYVCIWLHILSTCDQIDQIHVAIHIRYIWPLIVDTQMAISCFIYIAIYIRHIYIYIYMSLNGPIACFFLLYFLRCFISFAQYTYRFIDIHMYIYMYPYIDMAMSIRYIWPHIFENYGYIYQICIVTYIMHVWLYVLDVHVWPHLQTYMARYMIHICHVHIIPMAINAIYIAIYIYIHIYIYIYI